MPENSKKKFLEDFFFAVRPTRFFDRPATRNKLFPKVALRGLSKGSQTNQQIFGIWLKGFFHLIIFLFRLQQVETQEYIYDFWHFLIVSLVEFSEASLLLRYLNKIILTNFYTRQISWVHLCVLVFNILHKGRAQYCKKAEEARFEKSRIFWSFQKVFSP